MIKNWTKRRCVYCREMARTWMKITYLDGTKTEVLCCFPCKLEKTKVLFPKDEVEVIQIDA